MKLTSKMIALAALALVVMASGTVRAEEQAGFPMQKQIEMREIRATHSLRGIRCGMAMANAAVGEEIAPAVLFHNASASLTPAAKAEVRKVAHLIKKEYKGHKIVLSGYTDSKGRDAANQRLSYHRALAVMNQLVKFGVPASMLSAQGFGSENPVADNATAEGRAANRRVTFTVGE